MFTVNLMIVFHLAMCYMAYAPEWWYVVDTEHSSIFFTEFILWADIFIMPIMFFVAGYFSVMTLKKHGDGKWWSGKLKRIVLPWVIGAALFAAPTTYMILFSRNSPMDYGTFCNTLFFFNPETGGSGVLFSHVQYWYLGVLTVLYLLVFLFTKLDKNILEQVTPSLPGNSLIAGLFIMFFCNTFAMNIFTGNDDLWIHFGYFLVIQPCRILLYVIAIFLGVYAWKHQWFVDGGYTPSWIKWTPMLIVVSFAYPLWTVYGSFIVPSPHQFLLVKSLLQAALLLSAVFGLLGVFKRFFDGTNRFWGEMAANSYTMYYCHMQVIFPVAYFLLPIELTAVPKWILASAIGLVLSYAVSRVLILLPCFSGSNKAKVS